MTRNQARTAACAVLLATAQLMAFARPVTGSAGAPQQRRYEDAGGLVTSDQTCNSPQATGIGRVCFNVKAPPVVSLSVLDDAGLAVSATYVFHDGLNRDIGHGGFCQEYPGLAVPHGATWLLVYPHGNGLVRPPTDLQGRCAVQVNSTSGSVTMFEGEVNIGDGNHPGPVVARPRSLSTLLPPARLTPPARVRLGRTRLL
jgi:hypothetical protein